jgi:XisH protein
MARDKYHYHVREALVKDGWTITDDPYYIITPALNYPVDLGAEKIIGATKDNKKIAVEIKSFLAESLPNEFHTALGQYLDYETGIEDQEPDREIYLAIPTEVWRRIQKIPLLLKVLNKYTVDLIIYEIETKTIVQWIKK